MLANPYSLARFAALVLLFCLLQPVRAAVTDPAPAFPLWTNYQVIMWIGDSAGKQPDKWPLFFQRMREMGVTAGMTYQDGSPKPLLDAQMPYYVENIVNRGLCLKWNSKVKDWDAFVTQWHKQGRSADAFVRDYCMDDPKWLDWARGEMRSTATKHKDHAPLLYDIRDELSVTHSANPFDYDFSPLALRGFREWLKTQYKDLPALNAQWDTAHATWDDVMPFSTDQIKSRMASQKAMPPANTDWAELRNLTFTAAAARKSPIRWNFSPWCDFRTYMDVSLARTLNELRLASHAVDAKTPVGIEGTQMPAAFGGYDLWRLSQALDWVEPYDIGNARAIFGSFMPGKTFMATIGEQDADRVQRRLWHLLLEGDRGCIVWWSEDCIDWATPDYALTPKARALTPALKEMNSPVARILRHAKREYDPIAILYSQPSVQVDWLMESIPDGVTWHRRFSSFESEHNRMVKVRNSWVKLFEDMGFSPRFVSSEQVEKGALTEDRCQVLVLPNAIALSDREIKALQEHQNPRLSEKALRMAFFDGNPGLFDEHGRLRTEELRLGPGYMSTSSDQASWCMDPISARGAGKLPKDIALYARSRLQPEGDAAWFTWAETAVRLKREVELSVANPSANLPNRPNPLTRVFRYHIGKSRLLAFERGADYGMGENLKEPGGNETIEKPIALQAKLPASAHIYDLSTQQYIGFTDRISFTQGPWKPSLFALLPEKIPAEKLLEYLDQ